MRVKFVTMRSALHQSSRHLLGSLALGCCIIAQPELATPAFSTATTAQHLYPREEHNIGAM